MKATDKKDSLYNKNAEEAVLGSVMVNPDAYFEVDAVLKQNDFYLIQHRWIWEAFGRLVLAQQPIDNITLCDELERHSHLEQVGGPGYIASLLNIVPNSMHAENYARVVARDGLRRRLLEAATAIAKIAYDSALSAEDAQEQAQVTILGVRHSNTSEQGITIRQSVQTYLQNLQAVIADPSLNDRVLTGLLDVDNILRGIGKTNVVTVAGRPGSGKTSFMLSVAKNVAQDFGKRVVIFSLEMSVQEVTINLLSKTSQLDSQNLAVHTVTDQDLPVLQNGAAILSDFNIIIDDSRMLSPEVMRSKLTLYEMLYGKVDLTILDYVQLMRSGRRQDNRVQEVSDITRSLKTMVMDLGIPLLMGAQLNRNIDQRESKRPVLSDLRESGSIEQDSDTVMFIHRDDVNQRGLADLYIAKHRHGKTGDVCLSWHGPTTTYRNGVILDQDQIIPPETNLFPF